MRERHPDRRPKEERDEPPARPGKGNTITAQGEKHEPRPRTPNEHDESADSQAPAEASGRRMGELAHKDLAEGRQDTDKGPPLDAAYEKQKR